MFHFISGLPRSGSSLLASLLRQNPKCTASIMTPVGRIITQTLTAMGPDNEAEGFISDEQRRRVLQGIVSSYYADAKEEFVFDNNRRWCANAPLLADLFPDCRIICCVRSPAAIVDSFERLFRAHPLNLSVIYGARSNLTVYERVGELMKPGGVVGFALNAFRDAFFSEERKRLLLVNYDDLARYPERVMGQLHVALSLPHFNYQWDKIEQIPGADAFDQDVSTPGLHSLKPKIVYEPRTSVLPPDIYNGLPPAFWRVKEEATTTG